MKNNNFKKLKTQSMRKFKSIEWRKLIFCIEVFLSGYLIFLPAMVVMLCLFLLLGGDDGLFEHFFTLTTLGCFVLLIGIIWRKKKKFKFYSNINYYSALLLFFFPTINAQLTYSGSYWGWTLETGFDCLYPFGFGIISLFIQKVPYKGVRGDLLDFSPRYSNEFNPDVFSQMINNEWLALHFLSLLFTVVCVCVFNNYFKKHYRNKFSA